ncbi:MAG: minor capsid protein [Eubacteriales bacterium]|nr:minor capsid protein [Eubacteriales bacterium]
MFKADFKWDRPLVKIASDVTGGRDGQLFLAQQARILMDPYVPASQEEVLAQNVKVTADEEKGGILYDSPYAHYQWEGELYVDPKTGKGAFYDGEQFWSRPGKNYKVPSGKPLHCSDFPHPLATSHWDKAMMTARKDDLVQALDNRLKGRE